MKSLYLLLLALSLSACVTTTGTYKVIGWTQEGTLIPKGAIASGSSIYTVRNGMCIARCHSSNTGPDERQRPCVRKPIQVPEQAQYDFGNPSTFSAMKHRISCGLTGASRGIQASRR